MKVENFESSNGNKVANQFLITDGQKTIFQSYQSVIAIKKNGTVTLDKNIGIIQRPQVSIETSS